MEIPEQDQPRDRVITYLKWSAKIGGIYFCLRFLGAIILNTIFGFIFSFTLFQLFNILISVFSILLSVSLYVAIKQNVHNINNKGIIGYVAGIIGGIALVIQGLMVTAISISNSNFEYGLWLRPGMGMAEILLITLNIFAFLGFSILAYFSCLNKQLRTSSAIYIFVGAMMALMNQFTLSPHFNYYLLLFGFVNLLGLGWYFGLLQLAAFIELGKDQPTSAF